MRVSRFILWAVLITAVLGGLGVWMVNQFTPDRSAMAVAIATLVGFLTTISAYAITYSGMEKGTQQFLSILLTGMALKIVVGLISVVVVALIFKDFAREYVLAYVAAYLVFTVFEVYSLMRKLAASSAKA